ncbi:hypothetical protein D6D06_06360 [Aureobasidium pullulans]|nr:hypothetical protein D6D06_06360 [Aureobasidium pullulans]
METVSSDMTLDPHLKIDVDAQDQQAIDHPLIDATDLPMLWAQRVEDGSYNIVGALNHCQSKFDNRTLWQRIPIDGTYVHRNLAPVDCAALRATTISNTTANNKIYLSLDDYENEKTIAFAALYDYNSTKYSRETMQATARQQAAKRGAASRKVNKEKKKEELVVNVVQELAFLKEWQGLRDEEWKRRFDWIIGSVLEVTGVKLAPGST